VHILFVCTGNVCRSPVAERLTAAYARRLIAPELVASSAGTRAVAGHPMHPDSARALEELGGDASDHSARQVTAKLASAADLVLTMTKDHRNAVLELAPRQLNRTYTLYEAASLAAESGERGLQAFPDLRSYISANDVQDVEDPFGRAAAVHGDVVHEIARLLTPVLDLCRRDQQGR
jgi:protein-tyrosine phosphatase